MGCEEATKALTKAERSAEAVAQIQNQLASKVMEVSNLQKSLDAKTRELNVRSLLDLCVSVGFYLLSGSVVCTVFNICLT